MAGCQDKGPSVAKVSGLVTHNGKAIPNLTINFIPADGRPSWGNTDESGRYTLEYSRTQKGARVGTHKIWVNYKPQPKTPQEEMEMIKAGRKTLGPPPEIEAILKKYGEQSTSTLTAEVKSGGGSVDLQLD